MASQPNLAAKLLLLLVATTSAYPALPKTNTHTTLTVHLVPHTHDDVGWLKTVDQYFSGTNQTIQSAAVRDILDSILDALEKKPERVFTYIEQAFFMRWWRQLDAPTRARVKKLVASGQLAFANGGWCMHDEAAAHYVAMVDQTTLGHRMLLSNFGADGGIPTVQWQLDPFGHSSTHASLLSAEAGMDALFFGRIDYQDLELRKREQRAEFVWRASPALGPDAQVFAGLSGSYGGNYGPPPGFDWDVYAQDEPVEDNPALETYNVPARVDAFVAAALKQASMTRGSHIMWTMGMDFNYVSAEPWYRNMDKIIAAANHDGRVRAVYSSPDTYVAAKRAEAAAGTVEWPLTAMGADGIVPDFYPYADFPHAFWTGYFTSRPALKRYIRDASAYLNGARQLLALERAAAAAAGGGARASTPAAGWLASGAPELEWLEEAVAVAQHHDAVSGTAKQHVTFDYAVRLSRGVAAAEPAVGAAYASLYRLPASLTGCWRLNETVCALTQSATDSGTRLVAWNQLGQARSHVITIPVSSPSVTVTALGGGAAAAPIVVQVYHAGETVSGYARNTEEASLVASFAANVPAVGYAAFHVAQGEAATPAELAALRAAAETTPDAASGTIVLENEHLRLEFDDATGNLARIDNKAAGLSVEVRQSFCAYTSSVGDAISNQPSGAYLFRPKTGTACASLGGGSASAVHAVVSGGVLSEVRQVIAPWLTQTVRLVAGARHAEFEWTVGPVPFFGNETVPLGAEVVSRFDTAIASAGELLTDSNGREVLRRRRDYRPTWKLNQTEPVAGNYYPINTAVAIRDESAQLTVLTDRAQGAGSITDGSLELMVHRRLTHDDYRGVGEPLNETEFVASYAGPHGGAKSGPALVVRGTHLVTLEPPASAADVWRPLADRSFAAPRLVFAKGGGGADAEATFSALANELPPNVQLMTLEPLAEQGEILLRLSHQFGPDESEALSSPVKVDLAKLFLPDALRIKSAREVSLTNNQDKQAILKRRAAALKWSADGAKPHPWRNATFDWLTSSVAILGPLEVKSFVLQI